MTPRQHLERIDLGAVLAPFAALGDDVRVAIQDAEGQHLAGDVVGEEPGRAAGLIHAHGELAGRIVLHGPGAATELARATATALGLALTAAASGRTAEAPGGEHPVSALLEEELANGRRLQRSFVSLVPPDVPGYDIASHYEAAREEVATSSTCSGCAVVASR